MDFGAHLPLMDFGGHPYTLDHLVAYTKTAAQLGFSALSVNDHMVFSVPWLDGPVALAAVMEHSGDDDARDDGRARGGARTGAGRQDVGCDRSSVGRSAGRGRRSGLFARGLRGRRSRLRGTLATVRRGDRRAPGAVAAGRCAVRRPLLFDRGSVVGTLGRHNRSDRRSGWGAGAPTPGFVASPVSPTAGWHRPTTRRRSCSAKRGKRFARQLPDHGKAPDTFPNALATMWCYITDDRAEADRVLKERVVPTVHRPEEMLRERLPIGPPELFAEKLTAFAKAGVQRVFIWPVADEVHQLERFWNEVRPLVAAA